MEPEEIHEAFVYQQPTDDQSARIQCVRIALDLAFKVIRDQVPGCAEQTLSIRALETASMWSNKAIVFDGKRYL